MLPRKFRLLVGGVTVPIRLIPELTVRINSRLMVRTGDAHVICALRKSKDVVSPEKRLRKAVGDERVIKSLVRKEVLRMVKD